MAVDVAAADVVAVAAAVFDTALLILGLYIACIRLFVCFHHYNYTFGLHNKIN